MHFPRLTCTRGPLLLLWVLVLAWATAGHEEILQGIHHPELEEEIGGGWKVSRFFGDTLAPIMSKAVQSWVELWSGIPTRINIHSLFEGKRQQNELELWPQN